MTEPKKTTTRKTSAPRSTKPSTKYIRNLRNCAVHLRLYGEGSEKPYRVQLQPRGLNGDVASIPATCQNDTAFKKGIGVLFEIVTKTEVDDVDYPAPFDEQRITPEVIRTEDNTRQVLVEDSRGRLVKVDQAVGPKYTNAPGADSALHGQLNTPHEVAPVMPPLPRKVTVERKSG